MEATAMSATRFKDASRCVSCHSGDLRPARLRITLAYDGRSFAVDDDDALVCDSCGDELIGERATAFLLTQRALAPDADMSVTVTWRTESV
jgi:YgiT-type zinc finger domain-containing protein